MTFYYIKQILRKCYTMEVLSIQWKSVGHKTQHSSKQCYFSIAAEILL